jgi:hypothetical protein
MNGVKSKYMKKFIYSIVIAFLCFNSFSFGQKKEIQMIQIKYIDFTALTDSRIDCENFEFSGDYKKITITGRKIINTFEKKLFCGVKDTLKDYSLDARAKIILYSKLNGNDTICISKFGYCINNLVIQDVKFIDYIEKLIKSNDKNFSYKFE